MLADGREVVIKVQRPGIEDIMRCDLDVLTGLAQLAERVEGLAAFSPESVVKQLVPVLRRELDFSRERQNLELFAELLKNKPEVCIPVPIEPLCTRRIIVMTRVPGMTYHAVTLKKSFVRKCDRPSRAPSPKPTCRCCLCMVCFMPTRTQAT